MENPGPGYSFGFRNKRAMKSAIMYFFGLLFGKRTTVNSVGKIVVRKPVKIIIEKRKDRQEGTEHEHSRERLSGSVQFFLRTPRCSSS